MAPRGRSHPRLGWPDNLYTAGRGGYKYRHPISKVDTWMGNDQAKAFAAAKKLNALLMPDSNLVAKVTGEYKTIKDALQIFRTDIQPSKKWKPTTAKGYEIYLVNIQKQIGKRAIDQFTVKDCAEYIRTYSDSTRSRQVMRLVLIWIFAVAVQEGWIDDNPAEKTLKFSYERKRERLDIATYNTIWKYAPIWLKNAMDLSLVTLLRRDDVVSLQLSDLRDGFLWVVPKKTDHSTKLHLKLHATPSVSAILDRCKDGTVSPYFIHRLPDRLASRDGWGQGRVHHTQVLPEQITRAFADARKAAGIDGTNAPTFHEIRSLGAQLLRENGWTEEQIQGLMGHADIKTTRDYLEGHEPQWVNITPGYTLVR